MYFWTWFKNILCPVLLPHLLWSLTSAAPPYTHTSVRISVADPGFGWGGGGGGGGTREGVAIGGAE